uniref:S-locus receptor kinase C-terminal domain-containing protein n=5 Tax=Aegilops tauschii subsp. strangulata TaxID=200361 RepID=A0A453Q250_AEGTS
MPDETVRCIHIGLLCVQDSPNERPLVSSIMSFLENGDISLPPPKESVYFALKLSRPTRTASRGRQAVRRRGVAWRLGLLCSPSASSFLCWQKCGPEQGAPSPPAFCPPPAGDVGRLLFLSRSWTEGFLW